MYFNRFDRIIEGADFSEDVPRGKLCIHDEFVYTLQLNYLRKETQPFFAALFTGSSHSPYDMPFRKKITWGGDEMKYVNSIAYADSCLFDFVQRAKKEKWFNNTLFVFVADHSHRSPRGWTPHQPEYRRIPMLFWGNVLKDEYKGHRFKKVCSQVDIAATLLNQLGLPAHEFEWSKNLFNPFSGEFAYYETRDGFGFVRNGSYIVYSHTENKFHYEKTRSPEEKAKMEKEGKSYLQTVFQQFTDY
jgi:phosphoglycerol transferase MdoB-like AlkP superfamily enzyme